MHEYENRKQYRQGDDYMARSRRRRTVGEWIGQRIRYPMVLAVLALLSGAILVDARARGQYVQGVELNIAGGVFTAVIMVFFAEPVLRKVRESDIRVVKRFDEEDFIRQLAATRRSVEILETWTFLLDGQYRAGFLEGIRIAAANGAKIRILLLHPESDAAIQRSIDLDRDARNEIRQNLRHLRKFVESRTDDAVEVRLYSSIPSAQCYRRDELFSFTLYGPDQLSNEGEQLVIRERHTTANWIKSQFETQWNADSTMSLRSYLYKQFWIRDDDSGLTSTFQALYVEHDRIVYLHDQRLATLLFKHQTVAAFEGSLHGAAVELRGVTDPSDDVHKRAREKYADDGRVFNDVFNIRVVHAMAG